MRLFGTRGIIFELNDEKTKLGTALESVPKSGFNENFAIPEKMEVKVLSISPC